MKITTLSQNHFGHEDQHKSYPMARVQDQWTFITVAVLQFTDQTIGTPYPES